MARADRRFDVSYGYLLECDQLARALHSMLEHVSAKRISQQHLLEDTGLSNRQVKSLVSIGAATGLVRPGRLTLTPIGVLVARHDIFLETKGTLEWCHYVAASSYRNLLWYEIFNSLLVNEAPMTQEQWVLHFRSLWTGLYAERTLGKGLKEEVRLIADGYITQNFGRLGLLQKTSDDKLYRRRYLGFELPVLAAMVYDYAEKAGTHLLQVGDLSEAPGSPGYVFGVEDTGFRRTLEELHERGWIRYETTHGLDQVRLKPDFTPIAFLQAYYEESDPKLASKANEKETLF